MFLWFYEIVEELFNRAFDMNRDVKEPTLVSIFDFVGERAPAATIRLHSLEMGDADANLMIDEFYENAGTLDFWTNMIDCSTSDTKKEWLEWDYTPEGELYPVAFWTVGMPFHEAFQIMVDLKHTLEKGAPDYINDLYILAGSYMYAILSAASDEVRNGFYYYLLNEDDEFKYINHADLFNCHWAAMDMEYIVI